MTRGSEDCSSYPEPNGLERDSVEELLASTAGKTLPAKIDLLSARFTGYPYQINPLKGSAKDTEEFVVSFKSFDCVTFVEQILALSGASSVGEFSQLLRKLRYCRGRVDWLERNHYAIDWVSNNEAEGFLKNLTPTVPGTVTLERTLSLLPEYPSRIRSISYVPSSQLSFASIQTGDVLLFGTTRENLDVSHMGFAIEDRANQSLLLRHSSRSQGGVLSEPLQQFLDRFGPTPGLIWVRPLL